MKFIRLILISLSLLAPLGVGLCLDVTTTTRFSSASSPVVNPGKGWVSYGHPDGKSALELKFSTVGYERFDWAIVEPREDEFDWSAIDRFIDIWVSIGKKAAFGVMTANSHAGDGRFVTPRWVFDSGVKINARHISNDGDIMRGIDGLYIAPDNFNDPIFLSHLESFVRAFSERYDGDPRIAFIDIRSFENWGEGFSKAHLLLYKRYFKKTWLIQSSQKISDSKWIVDHGVGLRRDGIGGSIGIELVPAFSRTPSVAEFWGNLDYLISRGWWRDGELIIDLMKTGRPTYLEFLRGSPKFPALYSALINGMNNSIGFNFQLTEVSFSSEIEIDRELHISSKWLNTGQQKIFYPCFLIVGIFNMDGALIEKHLIEDVTPSTWLPGVPVDSQFEVVFRAAKRGTYRLALALADNAGNPVPTYAIDIDAASINDWYVIGTFSVR